MFGPDNRTATAARNFQYFNVDIKFNNRETRPLANNSFSKQQNYFVAVIVSHDIDDKSIESLIRYR